MLAILLATSGVAAAEVRVDVDPTTGLGFARDLVPPTAISRAATRTLYLNHKGVTVRPGPNDSVAQTSTLVRQPSVIPAWATSALGWEQTVACMREIWAPFDVTVTDVDPGVTPHLEAVFGGTASDLGQPGNIAGISPFAGDCGVIEHSIVFVFPSKLSNDPRLTCEVMSQEIGHSYGLDHELLATDPMTYLERSGRRTFQDRTAQCGESVARACGIGATACRASQNSKQLLLERLGTAGADNTSPTVVVMEPANQAAVIAGFQVIATATDDVGVASMTVYIDGVAIGTQQGAAFELATDPTLPPGPHVVTVEAKDARGNATHEERTIAIGDPSWLGGTVGCTTAPRAGLGLAPVMLALGLALRRRRRPVRR